MQIFSGRLPIAAMRAGRVDFNQPAFCEAAEFINRPPPQVFSEDGGEFAQFLALLFDHLPRIRSALASMLAFCAGVIDLPTCCDARALASAA